MFELIRSIHCKDEPFNLSNFHIDCQIFLRKNKLYLKYENLILYYNIDRQEWMTTNPTTNLNIHDISDDGLLMAFSHNTVLIIKNVEEEDERVNMNIYNDFRYKFINETMGLLIFSKNNYHSINYIYSILSNNELNLILESNTDIYTINNNKQYLAIPSRDKINIFDMNNNKYKSFQHKGINVKCFFDKDDSLIIISDHKFVNKSYISKYNMNGDLTFILDTNKYINNKVLYNNKYNILIYDVDNILYFFDVMYYETVKTIHKEEKIQNIINNDQYICIIYYNKIEIYSWIDIGELFSDIKFGGDY